MNSFKEEYIYPIFSIFYDLQTEYKEKLQMFKDEVQLFYKKTIFYLLIILFLYFCKDFILYLLRKFDKLLIN
tara:strand:+ start:38 stop:253 length:216 start_codon:yes stop_codon:yes gene_type:complete